MSPTTLAFLFGVLVGLALWACLFVVALHLFLARTSRPLAPWTAGDLRRAAQAGARARKSADDVWRDVP